MRTAFPLSSAQTGELLEGLRERIVGLCQGEREAALRLQEAVPE